MKVLSEARLPIFRSPSLLRLLVELFVNASELMSLTDLAGRTGISIGAVHKEVERLESAGLVISTRVGRSRLVSPNPASPFHHELRSLMFKAFGPAPLLRERLMGFDGVEEAFIYGSWAASEAGETMRQPRDIDLMVIGQPDIDHIHEICREVEEIVGREVNATILSPGEWESQGSGFLQSVREGPKVSVV